VPLRVRLHNALRRTYASPLIQNGESLPYVRDQLGHGSIKITVDTYGHLVPGEQPAGRRSAGRCDRAQPLRNRPEWGGYGN
jgi:hypothetical protein